MVRVSALELTNPEMEDPEVIPIKLKGKS